MIRLLIVDDHAIFRAGLKQILSDEEDFKVCGEAATAREAINLLEKAGNWDVMLLDISLPDRNGLEVLVQVKKKWPQLPVLILSAYPEDQYAARMMRAGAAGYLSKEGDPDVLINSIRIVSRGSKILSSAVAGKLISEQNESHEKPLHEQLSNREYQIFQAIVSGKSNSKIAAELSISVKTVNTYRLRMLEKMGMTKNLELALYAQKHHLLGL